MTLKGTSIRNPPETKTQALRDVQTTRPAMRLTPIVIRVMMAAVRTMAANVFFILWVAVWGPGGLGASSPACPLFGPSPTKRLVSDVCRLAAAPAWQSQAPAGGGQLRCPSTALSQSNPQLCPLFRRQLVYGSLANFGCPLGLLLSYYTGSISLLVLVPPSFCPVGHRAASGFYLPASVAR